MADFEDSSSPTFANQLVGQVNLRDAINGTIGFTSPDGKSYSVKANPAVLVVRPRGWHLPERHLTVDGETMSGALVDFGLYVFHNAHTLHRRDLGPYFYLPKLEAMEEAALWDDVMALAEAELNLPAGTMKATVLIETLPPCSRWTRSCTHCADASSASTAVGGTIFFRTLKHFAATVIACFPSVARS